MLHRLDYSVAKVAAGAVVLAVSLLFLGCRAYHIGNQGLFSSQVRTVGVSIVGNETWRRGYGERLTEALVREIENRTPYKVVPASRADTELRISIVGEDKSVTFQNDWADPRELSLGMTIKADWLDRRTMELRQSQEIDLDSEALCISVSTPLIAEAGQSNATSSQILMERLARHIVGMMETAW
ncbi:MAG: LPS assembly lipoprotein LptE [Planctomycetia bacterium]|nr:LPS assembly lipoprotein LptE [Planctomycetia bacterium]